MARDKGRRPGGRPPMRPTPTIDLTATEVTAAGSENAPPVEASGDAPVPEAATAFAASETDREPADPSVPPAPAEAAATDFAASEADRPPDAFEGLVPEGAPRPADEPVPMQPTDCWPALPDEEADVSPAKPEPPHSAFPSEAASPAAAASALAGAPRRAPPEPEAPSIDPKVFERPRRGMGRDDLREPREKRGRGGILPGILGGAVASGLVAAGLVASGLLPQHPDATDERRIAGIEASIRSLVETRAQAPAADPQLVQRLAAAEAAIKTFGETPKEPSSPSPDAALADRVAAAEAAAKQAGEQASAAAAEARRLAEAPSNAPAVGLPPAADTARLDALGTDIAAMRSEIGRIAEAARAAPADTGERLTALQQGQATIDQRIAEADRRLAEIARQAQEIGTASQQLGQRVEQADRRLAEADQARQSLGQEVATLAARENRPDADRQARLLVAVDALDRAIAAGRPYRAEIEAVKAVAPEPAVLVPLEETANSGLPTVPALAARARTALDKLAPLGGGGAASSGGLVDRLAAGARSLVKVTPAGTASPEIAPGEPRADFVARLAAGDLAGAGAAFAKMDPAGQQAVADIELAAAARRAATGILAGLRSGAIAALGSRS